MSELDKLLETLKIHNKDLGACFNDAVAVTHLKALIQAWALGMVGDDEDDQKYVEGYSENNAGHDKRVRNELRATLRHKIRGLK